MKRVLTLLKTGRWFPLAIGFSLSIATLLLWQALLQHDQFAHQVISVHSPLPKVIVIGGMVIAWLMALIVHLAMMAQRQAHKIYQKNQELIQEINKHQQAQTALAATEQHNRVLLDAIPDLMIRMKRDGTYLDCKPAKGFVSVFPPQELVGKTIYEVLPSSLAHQRMHLVEQALETGEVQSYEFQLVVGEENYYQEARIVVSGPDEVLVIIRDITDRHQIEVALERLMGQNELILNSAGEGICGLDLQGRITFINPAASRMLGYQPGELLYKSLHETVHNRRADGSPYAIADSPIHTSLREGTIQHRTDEVFWRRDGSSFPVEYISTPIWERRAAPVQQAFTDSTGTTQDEIVGTVVVFRDITERRSIERMKDEFISVVSHELRTPLTSIRGALGLIATGKLGELTDRGKSLLDIAVTNADRLVRLVNDILDLERIESGRVTMDKQRHDVAELMHQAKATMQTLADKAGITLSVTPLSVTIWVDGDRIIQTLTNLLSNAIKFSPAGSTIWLTAERVAVKTDQPADAVESGAGALDQLAHPYLRLAVQDQGRGIPPEKIEAIFGRFQQVDASDSREKGGTGLGLAICRSIVQQHDGHLWVESTLGQGSTFYFTLPILQEDSCHDQTHLNCG